MATSMRKKKRERRRKRKGGWGEEGKNAEESESLFREAARPRKQSWKRYSTSQNKRYVFASGSLLSIYLLSSSELLSPNLPPTRSFFLAVTASYSSSSSSRHRRLFNCSLPAKTKGREEKKKGERKKRDETTAAETPCCQPMKEQRWDTRHQSLLSVLTTS